MKLDKNGKITKPVAGKELVTITLNETTWFKIMDKLLQASTEDHSWGGCTIISHDFTLVDILHSAFWKGWRARS